MQDIIPTYPEASQPFGKALDSGQMVDDDSENVEKTIFQALHTKYKYRNVLLQGFAMLWSLKNSHPLSGNYTNHSII